MWIKHFFYVLKHFFYLASSDSGIQSMNTSLSEIETEFKRELTTSAREYTQSVKSLSKKIASSENLAEQTDDARRKSTSGGKMAPWLFDKQIIEDILNQAGGYASGNLHVKNNDFSLSVGYLQQNLSSINTVLRFRSPYSCSYESLAVFDQYDTNLNNNNPTLNTGFPPNKGHNRVGSAMGISPSMNQFNTPRKSLDVESNLDDDTSYDSTSQISIDQNGAYDFELINHQNLKLLIDPATMVEQNNPNISINQATVSSLNALKQQQYAMQQDITSFETIKRVLFNGVGGGIGSGGSNIISSNNSAAGGVAGSSTVGIGSTTGASQTRTSVSNIRERTQETDENENQLNSSLKIISDFKQKPFDELKQTLIKTNQSYVNTDKYKQVLSSSIYLLPIIYVNTR